MEVRPDGVSRLARRRALLGDARVSQALYAGDSRPAAGDDLPQVLAAPGLTVVRVVVLVLVRPLLTATRRRACILRGAARRGVDADGRARLRRAAARAGGAAPRLPAVVV